MEVSLPIPVQHPGGLKPKSQCSPSKLLLRVTQQLGSQVGPCAQALYEFRLRRWRLQGLVRDSQQKPAKLSSSKHDRHLDRGECRWACSCPCADDRHVCAERRMREGPEGSWVKVQVYSKPGALDLNKKPMSPNVHVMAS